MRKDIDVVVAGSGDPELVNEIMHLIKCYCEANEIVPYPIEIRDIMLSVAALSHLEAEGTDGDSIARSGEDFAEAARETFRDVTGVLTTPVYAPRQIVQVRN